MSDLLIEYGKRKAVVRAQRPRSLWELPAHSSGSLLAHCRHIKIHSGQTLFQQGSPHIRSYIVQDGLVRTYYTAATGREITLAYWSDGDLIGGPNFLGGGDHIWSATVVHQGEILSIEDSSLRHLAETDPEILRWIADTLSFKLVWLSILFQIHGTKSVRQRLAKLLVMLSDIYGEADDTGISIKHKISQTDLATLAGSSRQWTNRTLGEFKEDGLLDITNRRIRILDIERLDAISSDNPPADSYQDFEKTAC